MIRIKRGLNLPITGSPKQSIETGASVSKVAIIGDDFVGMKPSMKVKVGDKVKIGQALFYDKKNEQVVYTSPADGEVLEINRGERRVFQSIVISVGGNDKVSFSNFKNKSDVTREDVIKLLIESGEWTSLRTRPYSKVPDPDSMPHSIFINAADTNPLCADAGVVCKNHEDLFKNGVEVISKLTSGKTYVCSGANFPISLAGTSATHEVFEGPHPAGNTGTHIHYLDPVSEKKTVWNISYQDVIAIGSLFKTGELFLERVISLAGPQVKNPRLVKTIRGACLCDLTKSELADGENRVISGSVFGGRKAGKGPFCYLGKFHNQVTVLLEGRNREFLGWQKPGLNKFSIKSVFLSKLIPSKKFAFTTNKNGSLRSIVPIGAFEKVMPMDIQPTFLLRSLMSYNTDKSKQLGCLELDEEDLALCTFVDPCKNNYGPVLRENLVKIEKEG